MTRKPVKDIAASIRQRLQNIETLRRDFQYVLIRYASERLLYRLSRSSYRDRFVLKGAMLFVVWSGARARPTKDIDLLWNSFIRRRYIGEAEMTLPAAATTIVDFLMPLSRTLARGSTFSAKWAPGGPWKEGR